MPADPRAAQGRRGTRNLAAPDPRRSLRRQAHLSPAGHNRVPILLTSGEPAGIGPDICLSLAQQHLDTRIACLGDPDTFAARRDQLGLPIETVLIERAADAPLHRPGLLPLIAVPLAEPAEPGQLNPANARAVLGMLERAVADCLSGEAAAMVTAPVHKSVINAAGIRFSGHTEYLAGLTGTDRVVMLLTSATQRVALLTTHLPLAEVPGAITARALRATVRILSHDLAGRFGIERPRILVLGLNPHAGEDGVLGTEETRIIGPTIASLAAEGFDLTGPVAADSAFTAESLASCDVVLAMYHDQGLAPLKAMHFGEIVNVTLGLPIVRTSVDHGTALALAGSGRARDASLKAALDLAVTLSAPRAR